MPFIMTSLMFYHGYVLGEARLPSSHTEYKLLNMFELIKAVSDTVSYMINAIDNTKPLVFIGAMFWETLISHHHTLNINC